MASKVNTGYTSNTKLTSIYECHINELVYRKGENLYQRLKLDVLLGRTYIKTKVKINVYNNINALCIHFFSLTVYYSQIFRGNQ